MVFTPDGDAQDGVTQKVSKPFVNPNTRELKPVFLQSVQDVANQIQFIPPPNPDGSTTFNTGSTVPLKFLLKDKNGNPIANAAVTLVTQKGTVTPQYSLEHLRMIQQQHSTSTHGILQPGMLGQVYGL